MHGAVCGLWMGSMLSGTGYLLECRSLALISSLERRIIRPIDAADLGLRPFMGRGAGGLIGLT